MCGVNLTICSAKTPLPLPPLALAQAKLCKRCKQVKTHVACVKLALKVELKRGETWFANRCKQVKPVKTWFANGANLAVAWYS